MLSVTCYRHGQSAANAGEATDRPDTIALTALGHAQADAIAQTLHAAPDLIVTSPFTRAQQTARPAQQRFPATPVQTWDIGEFVYLCPDRCAGTTAAQRKPWVEDYWARGDAHFRAGPRAESFAQFIGRVQACLARLQELARLDSGHVVLFGHGQFFSAMRWLSRPAHSAGDAFDVPGFRRHDLQFPLANASAVAFSIDAERVTVR